MKQKLYLSGI